MNNTIGLREKIRKNYLNPKSSFILIQKTCFSPIMKGHQERTLVMMVKKEVQNSPKKYICMKIVNFVFAALFLNVCFAQSVQFSRTSHDFGKVREEGGTLTTTFEFTNKGIKPIMLTEVVAACGCTTPEWTRSPVEPNQTGFIKVVFDPKDKIGVFTKTISVTTDSEPSTVVLTIKGEVLPRPKSLEELYPAIAGNLRFTTDYVVFGDVYHDKTDTASIIIFNAAEVPVTLKLSESDIPSFLEIEAEKLTIDPKQTTTLKFTYLAENKRDWGYCFDYFYLKTTDALQPEKRINLSANIKENFSGKTGKTPVAVIDRTQHSFGDVWKNTSLSTSFTLKNTGQNTLILRKLKPSCGCTVLRPEKTSLEPNESTVVEVNFNTGNLTQRKRESVTIITNDPKRPEIEFFIEANVK